MAANQILVVAQGGGANVQSQTDYAADTQLTTGNQPGVARSAFVNKTLRQVSAVAAGVAQFLADYQTTDVTDSLTPANYSAAMKAALNSLGLFTTQTAGDNSTRPATTAFVQAAVAATQASGALVYFPATAAPSGYVKANGALLSRTTYANLWAFAQISGNLASSDGVWTSGQFSPGDGSTTFRLPDLRGYHTRAWDDARGVDSGRGLGTTQGDALASHNHTGTVTVNDPGHYHGVDTAVGNGYIGLINLNGGGQGVQNTQSKLTGITASVSIDAAGGSSENRVKNIALLACLKY